MADVDVVEVETTVDVELLGVPTKNRGVVDAGSDFS